MSEATVSSPIAALGQKTQNKQNLRPIINANPFNMAYVSFFFGLCCLAHSSAQGTSSISKRKRRACAERDVALLDHGPGDENGNAGFFFLPLLSRAHASPLTRFPKDDFKSQDLPLARIKKIMKADEEVQVCIEFLF